MSADSAHFCSLNIFLTCQGRTNAKSDSVFRILARKYQKGEDLRSAECSQHVAVIRFCVIPIDYGDKDGNLESEDEDGDEYPKSIPDTSIRMVLLELADWLLSRPEGAFKKCRELGLKLSLTIFALWKEESVERVELFLPAKLLLACGQADIEISFEAISLLDY